MINTVLSVKEKQHKLCFPTFKLPAQVLKFFYYWPV